MTKSGYRILWKQSCYIFIILLYSNYSDDVAFQRYSGNILHAALVLSTRPHAEISRLQCAKEKALELEGVIGYFDHRDTQGRNLIGPVEEDEECFANKKVTCVGQVCIFLRVFNPVHIRFAEKNESYFIQSCW